jgi:hypothetical protein
METGLKGSSPAMSIRKADLVSWWRITLSLT